MSQFEAEAIGARIAQARLEAGLTQEDLAEMASFSKRSLQDYEAGKTIPYKHMREIGRLLNKPTEWFLRGDEEPDVDSDGFSALLEAVERLDGEVQESNRLLRELLDQRLPVDEAQRRV